MNSRDVISHPGPRSECGVVCAQGKISLHTVHIKAGDILLNAVSGFMDVLGCDSGVLVLDKIDIGPFDYVIPSHSTDEMHVAWYSETHACPSARIQSATAIVGKRDGAWWIHCHALWDSGGELGMGHLLPDKVIVNEDVSVTLRAFTGGSFNVSLNPETAFEIFHVNGGNTDGNALIAKINPHQDLYSATEELLLQVGFEQAIVFGIGSLIGAHFKSGDPMKSPISEVLILDGASWDGSLSLPVHCVDTDNRLFHGHLLKGCAPVLVTFEIMIIEGKA
ncbi:MAG: hypothetical protein AB8B87_23445 [Granulosicoccus sp.]